MPFANGYRGQVGGAVQVTYTDQPGQGMPGMLAFASDLTQHDALYIGEADGIPSGAGCIITVVADDVSSQRPNEAIALPDDETLALADFGGMLIFDEHCQSDELGRPGWAQGRIGRVLRNIRAGGRAYVPTQDAVDHTADSVFWCVKGGTDTLYAGGEFLPAALANTALAGYTVELTNARWVTSSDANALSIVEFLG